MTEDRIKLYCKHCGSKLVQNTQCTGYDEFTGAPICPFMDQKMCSYARCRELRLKRMREILAVW